MTFLLYALLAIVVMAVLFFLAVMVLPKGEQIAPPAPDVRPWAELPGRRVEPADLVAVRLPVALRGYRFAETDRLLDRLTDELRRRDDEIAALRAGAHRYDDTASTDDPTPRADLPGSNELPPPGDCADPDA